MLRQALYLITRVRGIGSLLLLRLGIASRARLVIDSGSFSGVWISNPGWRYAGAVTLNLDVDTVSFIHDGRRVQLYYGSLFQLREDIRSIIGIFYNELYRFPEMDRTVVFDVGASVGDSTVYLAPYSKRIYAVEPYPYAYSLLKRNLALNNLSSKVRPLNCAVSDKQGTMELTQGAIAGPTSFLRPSGLGVRANSTRIRLLTLSQLAALHRGKDRLSLKLHCMGYEHRILLNSSNGELRLFSNILVNTLLEGHEEIAKRLAAAGFKVRVSKAQGKNQALIFASRRKG